MAKKKETYEMWRARLPEGALEPSSPGLTEYQDWVSALAGELPSSGEAPVEVFVPTPENPGQFGVVECGEGEVPLLKLFKTAKDLAEWIGRQAGRDVFVFPFHGVPLRLMAEPPMLLLAGGDAYTIPPRFGERATYVSPGLIEDPVVSDGYLGPVELAVDSYAATRSPASAPDAAADDDGDET